MSWRRSAIEEVNAIGPIIHDNTKDKNTTLECFLFCKIVFVPTKTFIVYTFATTLFFQSYTHTTKFWHLHKLLFLWQKRLSYMYNYCYKLTSWPGIPKTFHKPRCWSHHHMLRIQICWLPRNMVISVIFSHKQSDISLVHQER